MGKFLSKLDVEQVEDTSAEGRGTWRLLAPLIYEANSGVTYTVPAGFVTDFSSVPRIPVVFDLMGDRANYAGTLHDWAYSKDSTIPTRLMADGLIKEAALAQGCPSWVAWALYFGVRIGGQSHWRK